MPSFGMSKSSPTVAMPTDPPRKRSTSSIKAGKLASFFSSSPKASATASAALLAAHTAANAQHGLSSPGYSLPTISVSDASTDSQKMLFSPPSAEEAHRIARAHAQFGPISDPGHTYVSKHTEGEVVEEPIQDDPPYYYLITTYLSYLILIIFGHVRDFFGKRFKARNYKHLKQQNGYAPLNSDFDNFYVRRLKMRINDCFSRPITGVPGRFITLLDRVSNDHNATFQFTGKTTETLNMSSYNYLGFAQSDGPCADATEETIRKYGMSSGSTRAESGTQDLHVECEKLVARFVGKPDAMVFSMGFATNSTSLPAIVGKGCLIISDELNHSSLRFGSRLSGACITMFKHNDMEHLEEVLREAISQGQPRTHRPWKKILVVVEGLYSMEGTMCNLPALIELKKKYKYYLFIDEAHSIGALGPRGRGVCDYFNIDPKEVDILMGTLTKSFGANGGYIAAEKAIIDRLRLANAGYIYGEAPTPPVIVQIMTALRMIAGDICPGQGEERLQRLAFNSRYLRLGLKRLGFIVYGQDDSPIIPLLLYSPAKMPAFSHEMLKRKIAVVIVGYPATPLVSSRARFCVSAAHTKDDLDRLLQACDEIGDILQLKFSSGVAGGKRSLEDKVQPPRWTMKEILERNVEDTKAKLL